MDTTPSMSSHDILFIRACKVANSEKRLRILHRRLYLVMNKDVYPTVYLINILCTIVQKYCPLNLRNILVALSPTTFPNDVRTYDERVLGMLINTIAFTESTVLQSHGFRPMSRFLK